MRLTSLEPNCHFCYLAKGLTVSNFLLLLRKQLSIAGLLKLFCSATHFKNVFFFATPLTDSLEP